MLPTYSRLSGSTTGGATTATTNILTSTPATSILRRLFRSREKCLIALVFVTLVFVCFGGVFYLPDDFGAGERVRNVYKHLQKAGPEMFIPAPPLMGHSGGAEALHGEAAAAGAGAGGAAGNAGVLEAPYLRRAIDDRAKLNAKIEEEMGRIGILEKPDGLGDEAPLMNAPAAAAAAAVEPATLAGGSRQQQQKLALQQQLQQQQHAVGAAPEAAAAAAHETSPATGFVNGEDRDPRAREQRNKVKEVCARIEWFFSGSLLCVACNLIAWDFRFLCVLRWKLEALTAKLGESDC